MAKKKSADPTVLATLIHEFGMQIPEEWVPAWMLIQLRDSVERLRQADNIALALKDHVSVMAPVFDLLGHVNLTYKTQHRKLKRMEAERAVAIRGDLILAAVSAKSKPPTEGAISTAVQADETLNQRWTQVEALEALKYYLLEQRTILLERGQTVRERSTNLRVYQREDAGAS
jgi:hypothetical protein